ncbi:AcrR family transcriptional regulator [Streptomyces olivoverticillatus]|uniref:AcrR family transcriptional regulator n=1 Tax=Streptomyces olivoverticillatus TaxID=66427 RepID=A0A7W7LQ61_9ACTN|nr:TetR/AcrR family transcriptional regulator [Streptomyces olivoverticillatus]MBB4894239.1 AcrR family transcriptional regulator [Streptomyces olivoverticillatus]
MQADEKHPQPPIPSVWTRPRRGKREQPALSREQIVSVALELLDTEGIDALSMRKLGTRLNAGATSLYTYVANKDELIELVVDEVYGEIEIPDPAAGIPWRAAAADCAHSFRAVILNHPWTASVLGELGVTQLGPNVMRLSESMLALFESAGLPAGEADFAVSAVGSYVIGTAVTEAAWLTTLARLGRSEEEWLASLLPTAEEAARDHPQLREQYASLRDKNPRETREEKFDYGLQRVLDGLETRLGQQP